MAELRAYQGRVLPDQEEELVDQGFSFDVRTLLGRRTLLASVGIGAATLTLAACSATGSSSSASTSAAATSDGEIPEETNGPYPGDGTNGPDVLEESGIVRRDIRSSFGTSTTTAEGVPMQLRLTLTDLADGGKAFAGAAVYVWQCDRDGRYSLYSDGITDENYLRGVQVADDDGVVTFTSIYPACYTGRWPHVHFEVYPGKADIDDHDAVIATSQVALPKAVNDVVYATAGYEQSVRNMSSLTLKTDNVFGDDGGVLQLATVTGSVAKGYTVRLPVAIDTRTAPDAGGSGGGQAPSGEMPSGEMPSGSPGGTRPSGMPSGMPSGGPGGTPPSGMPSGAPPSA